MKADLQLYKFFLFFFFYLVTSFFIKANEKDTVFVSIEDSISILIQQARNSNNGGEPLLADSLLQVTYNYFKESTSHYEKTNSFVDSLRFEIENAIAWNTTLREDFILAEKRYKDLILSIPDSCHRMRSKVYTGISSLYGMHKKYDFSEKYALYALKEAELANDALAAFAAQSNLGDIYLETGNYEQALEKFLEVRRLSVATGQNEIISSMNLGLVYFHLGKFRLAEEYIADYITLCKDSMPVLYSIVLPTYCEILIKKGEKEQASRLILDVVADPRYTQRSDYNYQYLMLLAELYPISQSSSMIYILYISTGILLLLFLFFTYRNKKKIKKIKKEYNQLISQLEEINRKEEDISESGKIILSHEQTLQLIGLVESLPNIYEVLNKMRQKADSKLVILSSIKELQNILLPFNSDKIEKEIAYYIEQSNHKFYDKLKTVHSQLNLTDLRLCTLIKLGMNTKEIAVFTNKSVRGIESAKFRLRKKMDLDSSKDIYDYFLELDK